MVVETFIFTEALSQCLLIPFPPLCTPQLLWTSRVACYICNMKPSLRVLCNGICASLVFSAMLLFQLKKGAQISDNNKTGVAPLWISDHRSSLCWERRAMFLLAFPFSINCLCTRAGGLEARCEQNTRHFKAWYLMYLHHTGVACICIPVFKMTQLEYDCWLNVC